VIVMLRASLLSLLGAVAVAAGCNGSDEPPTSGGATGGGAGTAAGGTDDAGSLGSAGRSETGGRAAVPDDGGAPGRSGAPGSGGTPGRSGAPGGGGTPGRSGVPARGGTPGRSGAPARAGSTNQAAGNTAAAGAGGETDASTYDAVVLADGPALYLALRGETSEPDLTGNGHDGSYHGGAPARAELPNGDPAADFDGVQQYLSVPSAAALSISTTHELTWEAWIRPGVLQFAHATSGYVDWMGKCEEYAPSCEWEARIYSLTNSEDRCNRLSAYAFNPDAALGSGAFWQQSDCGVSIVANAWYHVVGEYTTLDQPAGCSDAASYPGAVDIWVNGVRWHQASHGQTGCMSQYKVVPVAGDSPLNIGTMAHDAWFEGAVGKVAIYDRLLSASDISRHYAAMTGEQPTGSCADTCSF
jgi:hypothetical protein